MSSQHLYALADQLGGFDIEFDPNKDEPSDADRSKEHFSTYTLESPSISEVTSVDSTSNWTIGWVTPSAILSCFLIAVSLATAHLGLFRWLNHRRIDESISQPYVTALSYAFVNGFRLLLAAALGISFVQMVWKILRVRPMQLGDLDRLLSVLGNPLQLGRVTLLWRAPIPFLCAFLFWCLPIAMIFPPGALTVETMMVTSFSEKSVPTIDPAYIGNGTYQGMLSVAFWETDNLGNYGGPTNAVRRIGTQAILAGSYIASASPCGQNCSYSINITAPMFKCDDSVSPNLFNWINSTYPQYGAFQYEFAAYPDSDAQDEFVFDISWADGGLGGGYQNLSCTAHEAVYTLQVDYREGQQTVKATGIQSGQPLKSSNLTQQDYGLQPDDGDNVIINATSTGSGGINIVDTNKIANMAAIQGTVTNALSGYLDALILHAQKTANTVIALSSLYSGTPLNPHFNITEESMQELLQNIVVSLLSLNQTTVQTTVTESTTVSVYSFSNPARLILPYFLSLFLSLAFIIGGGHALVSNGISASTGGLFQTLCTTRGSERLNELAAKGCLGGRENVPEDLKNLKVMFGVLRNHSSSKPMAGLGTQEEVIPLVKGGF